MYSTQKKVIKMVGLQGAGRYVSPSSKGPINLIETAE